MKFEQNKYTAGTTYTQDIHLVTVYKNLVNRLKWLRGINNNYGENKVLRRFTTLCQEYQNTTLDCEQGNRAKQAKVKNKKPRGSWGGGASLQFPSRPFRSLQSCRA